MRRSGLPRSCPSISGTVTTPVDSNGRSSCPLTSADAVSVADVSGSLIVVGSSAASDVNWLLRRFARASKGHPSSKPMRPLTSPLKVGSPTSNRTAPSALLAVNSTRPSARPSMATSPAAIENVPVGCLGEPATSNSTEASSRCRAAAADRGDDRGEVVPLSVRTDTASFSPRPEIRMRSRRRSMLASSRSHPSPRFRRRPVTFRSPCAKVRSPSSESTAIPFASRPEPEIRAASRGFAGDPSSVPETTSDPDGRHSAGSAAASTSGRSSRASTERWIGPLPAVAVPWTSTRLPEASAVIRVISTARPSVRTCASPRTCSTPPSVSESAVNLASSRGDASVPVSVASAVARPPCSTVSRSAGRNPFRRRSRTASSSFADWAPTRPVKVDCGRLARSRSTEMSAAKLVSPSNAPRECTLQRPPSPVASTVAIVARGAAAFRTAIWMRPLSDSGPSSNPGHVTSATSVSGAAGSADALVTGASRRAFSTLTSARRELEPSSSPTTRRALPFRFAPSARLEALYRSIVRSVPDQRPATDTLASVTSCHCRRLTRPSKLATGWSSVPPTVPDASSSPSSGGTFVNHFWSSPSATRASYVTSRSPRLTSRYAVPPIAATGDSIVIDVRASDVPASDTSARARSKPISDVPRRTDHPPETTTAPRTTPGPSPVNDSESPRTATCVPVGLTDVSARSRTCPPWMSNEGTVAEDRSRDRGRTLRCGVEHDFGLGDIEPAEHEGSAENSGGEVDVHALRVEERTRRGRLPDGDGVQRDAERAGPVVETGGACLDPELIKKRRGQGAQQERLARRRGKEEGAAGEDHQQQHDENDRQAHRRTESARDEVARVYVTSDVPRAKAASLPASSSFSASSSPNSWMSFATTPVHPVW